MIRGRSVDPVGERGRIEAGRIGIGVLERESVSEDRQDAAVAERLDELAGLRVGRHQLVAVVGVDPAVDVKRSAHGAAGEALHVQPPHLLSRHRVESEHRRTGVQVHQTVDDQRRGLADIEPGRHVVGPPLPEPAGVLRVDLIELGEALVVRVQVVARPVHLAAAGGDHGRLARVRRGALPGLGRVEAQDRRSGEGRRHADASAVWLSHRSALCVCECRSAAAARPAAAALRASGALAPRPRSHKLTSAPAVAAAGCAGRSARSRSGCSARPPGRRPGGRRLPRC